MVNSFWDEAKQVLGVVAPTLGSAVGGPLGGLAANLLVGALGLDPTTPAPAVAAAIVGATPDQLLAIKSAEQQFTLALKQLDVSAETVAAGDRASARERETAVKDRTPAILAYGLTVGFFGLLTFLCFASVPTTSHDLLVAMTGVLGTAWISCVGYYFGTSAGSDRKTELLAQSTPPLLSPGA